VIFFAIIRLDGLDPTLAWGMGAHTGHTAVALRFDGELYVFESTTNSAYWPTNGIQRTPFSQWVTQAHEADYNVLHLPLSPEAVQNFNVTAAVEWFSTVEGLPYGFNNMLFCWVDTETGNYPCLPPDWGTCLPPEVVEWLAGFVDRIDPQLADKMFNLALNKRLNNTQVLRVPDVVYQASQLGLSFQQLVMLPEQDSWVYPTGKQMVCDVFVCQTWKNAGLFGSLSDEIQCTEFTNWDAYAMSFFDSNYVRPQECVNSDPTSQFCQIMGNFQMSLPGYNTKTAYPEMADSCPSLNPQYYRPPNC